MSILPKAVVAGICMIGSAAMAAGLPNVQFFKVNNDAAYTQTTTVTLNNWATDAAYYRVSERQDFAGATWLPYSSAPQFRLSPVQGVKTVYFQIASSRQQLSRVFSDSIILQPQPVTTGAGPGRVDSINRQQNTGKNLQQQVLPGTPGNNRQGLPDKRAIGENAGTPKLNVSDRLPGAGGSATSQQNNSNTSPLPASNTLVNPADRNNRPGGTDPGKKVGPDYFKTDAQKLKDLADPNAAVKESGASGRSPLGRKTAEEVLGGAPGTVRSGDGKNSSSRRSQQSSDSTGNTTREQAEATRNEQTGVSSEREAAKIIKEQWGVNSAEEARRIRDQQRIESMTTPVGSVTAPFRPGGPAVTTTGPGGRITGTRTPDPDKDTGDGHTPKGLIPDKQPKSPSDYGAERRRKVTMPGEGAAQPEKVYMEMEDNLKQGIGQRTDGRIDFGGRSDDGTTTGSGQRGATAGIWTGEG